MSSEKLLQVLQKAGTVLCNSSGHIYFDLNGKSPADCQTLTDVLHGIARLTNSQIVGNVPHPMTQSAATLQLLLNVDPENPATGTSKKFRDLLFQSGNAFYYEVGLLHEAMGRYAATDDNHKMTFMQNCQKMLPNPHGDDAWKLGRSLSDYVVLAVALNSNFNGLRSVTHVPANLYGLDSVKAIGVETVLRGAAHSVDGKYSRQTSVVHGGAMVDFHVVESEQVTQFLANKRDNAIALLDHVFASEVQAEVVRFSPGPTNVAPLPNVGTTGDILRDLNIQSVDISTMGDPVLGRAFK